MKTEKKVTEGQVVRESREALLPVVKRHMDTNEEVEAHLSSLGFGLDDLSTVEMPEKPGHDFVRVL